MKGSSLLVGDELANFDQDQAKVRRRVLQRGQVEGTRRTAARVVDSARTLDVLVSDELTSVARASRETGRAIKVLTIGVLKDDGMSWSAAMAERAAARAGQLRKISLTPVCIRGRASLEGDPEIIDIVGVRRLVRLAQKHHLTRAFPLLRPWIRVAVIPGAILLTALAQILAASLQASTPKNLSPTTLLTNPAYIVLALVVAGALLAAQWAAAQRPGRPTRTPARGAARRPATAAHPASAPSSPHAPGQRRG